MLLRRDRASAGCRLCGDRLERELIDFGSLPVATHAAGCGEVPRAPLRVWVCEACGLVQTDGSASAVADQRQDGVCLPSQAPAPEEEGRRVAAAMVRKWRLSPASRVVRIGGDAGVTRHLEEAGIPVLDNPLPIDSEQDCGTRCFNAETAVEIAARDGRADAVVVGDVITRVSNLFEFAAGLAGLVRPGGVISITAPHVLGILQQAQFDAFRHDVRNYLSLRVLERLLCSVGLRVFDAERVPDQGGLLRIQACPISARHTARPGLKAVRIAETTTTMNCRDLYSGFASRVAALREEAREFLRIRHAAGRRVAAFGATSRGAAMLNVAGLSTADIACVGDADATLSGRVMPGSGIPIMSLSALAEDPPNDLLILPWSQAQDVQPVLAGLRQRGVQFWTLLPRVSRV